MNPEPAPLPLAGHRSPARAEPRALEASLADAPPLRARLFETLLRAAARRVEHVHVEPAEDGWRLRWRRDDTLEERRLGDDDALPTALATLASEGERHREASGRADAGTVGQTAFTARLEGARHVVTLDVRRVALGDTYVLTLHGRTLAPPRLDALVDDPLQLRTLRTLARRPVGWLPLAASSRLDGERLVRAFAQELASPEAKLVCLEPRHRPPLPRVVQLELGVAAGDGAASLVALDPDAVLLAASPPDRTLVELAARATEDLLVVHRVRARRPSEVMRRLLAIGLAPAWLALALPGIVVRHRVRLLCPHCRRPAPPDCGAGHRLGTLRAHRVGDVAAWLERSLAPRFEEGDGCAACAPLGGAGTRDVTDIVVPREDVREALLHGDVDFALRRVDADGELAERLTALVDAGTISATEAARHLVPRY